MLSLPFNLLLLCANVLGNARAEQCRLVVQNHQVVFTGSPTTAVPSLVPSATVAGGSSPSATGLSNASTPGSGQAFNYGRDMIRGVNLGGWLVLEPWITPSIFQNTNNNAIIDEYTFGQMQNYAVALSVLQNHWNTWITEDDFIAISAAHLNHVRIPLGYWSVPLTSADTNYTTSVAPYIPGAWPYLLRALSWAKKHSLHVILDLHGAPGSQNGYDNSGQRTNNPMWAWNPANVSRTLDALRFIATNIGGMVDVVELLNEPAGFLGDQFVSVLKQFWLDGYQVIRAENGGIMVMIGDGFIGVDNWSNFLTYPNAQGVLMDHHEYQIFSVPELSRSFSDHITFACGLIPDLKSFSSSNIYTIIGEWSNAPTDCAQWLNGRGVGARWDGTLVTGTVFGSCQNWTGDWRGFSDSYKAFLRQYWEVQVEIGENIQGWVFWTWKTEIADEWSYQKGLEGGWIPQDPTNRMYPNICG